MINTTMTHNNYNRRSFLRRIFTIKMVGEFTVNSFSENAHSE